MGCLRSVKHCDKPWRKPLGPVLVLGVLVGMLGCGAMQSTPKAGPPKAEEGRLGSFQFEDLPFPPGMTVNRGESFVYEAGSVKTGIVVYEGEGDVSQIGRFFREKMPQYDWKLLSHFELQNAMLVFMKERRMAIIFILPQEGPRKRVEIRVGPVEVRPVPAT